MPEDQLLAELIALRAEVQGLRNELSNLQNDLKKLHVWSSPARGDDLWEWVEEIDACLVKTTQASIPQGGKTATRIAKLKEILKARGGSQTFKKLQEDLDLSPSEFTYLVGCLDKRSFEVGRRPGTKRGEKVLSLRVRIVEPVVFK
jgi:hypothetical protein